MIQGVAFFVYPVSDMVRARRFYEETLGLAVTHSFQGEWIEYDLGDTTFAITRADAEHPTPVRGAMLALELADLDIFVNRLKALGVPFKKGTFETPVCRGAVVLDPDGSEILLHQRRVAASTHS